MAVNYFCGIQHSSGAFAGSSFSAHASSVLLSPGAFCRTHSNIGTDSSRFPSPFQLGCRSRCYVHCCKESSVHTAHKNTSYQLTADSHGILRHLYYGAEVRKRKTEVKIRRGNSSAALVNFRMCFFLRVSWHLCNLIFQIAMWNILTVCRSIWPPTGDTTPITTPPC